VFGTIISVANCCCFFAPSSGSLSFFRKINPTKINAAAIPVYFNKLLNPIFRTGLSTLSALSTSWTNSSKLQSIFSAFASFNPLKYAWDSMDFKFCSSSKDDSPFQYLSSQSFNLSFFIIKNLLQFLLYLLPRTHQVYADSTFFHLQCFTNFIHIIFFYIPKMHNHPLFFRKLLYHPDDKLFGQQRIFLLFYRYNHATLIQLYNLCLLQPVHRIITHTTYNNCLNTM